MSERGVLWRSSLVALHLLSAAALLALLAAGADFYRTPLLERAHHDGYWQLKAGGTIGHTLGVVGSAMMVLMLVYSLRKRVGALRRLGPLGRWLDVHIFLGVFGPLLVVLHSTLQGARPRGAQLLVDGGGRARAACSAATSTCRSRARAPARSSRSRSSRRRTASCRERLRDALRPRRRGARAARRARRPAPARSGLLLRLCACSSTATCGCASALRAFARGCGRVPRPRPRASSSASRGRRPLLHRRIAALGPPARALPLLARLPQAVRGRDVPVHGRARRGGGRDRLRLGRAVVSGSLPPALVALALALLPHRRPAAQISPGPLSRAAREARGQLALPRLPRPEAGRRPGQVPGAATRRCSERIAAGKGLHARPEYRDCKPCHVEHHGVDFELVWWGKQGRAGLRPRADRATPSRASTRARLRAMPRGLRRAGRLRRASWARPWTAAACHKDEHRGEFQGRELRVVPRRRARGSRRPGSTTRGRAGRSTGRHAAVACEQVPHAARAGSRGAGQEPARASVPSPAGTARRATRTCTAPGWAATARAATAPAAGARSRTAGFDHDKTAYPLQGKHAAVACAACHKPGPAHAHAARALHGLPRATPTAGELSRPQRRRAAARAATT